MTEKLYLQDSYISQFEAAVLSSVQTPGGWEVILDRTAFYPEGGGQPSDSGEINGIAVIAVREENGQVIHLLNAALDTDKVTGRIDWRRRFYHMQQHSGQHVLSAVFDTLFTVETVGFHLGADATQIDLAISDLSPQQALAAEEAANAALYANTAVNAEFVSRDDLARYGLRKPPAKDYAQLRLVSIPSLDCCPCGGTHVNATGEIGIIKIRSWERKNGAVRLDFVCGERALADYQLKNRLVQEFSSRLSAAPEELSDVFSQRLAKADSLAKELAAAKLEIIRFQAVDLFAKAPLIQSVRLVSHMLTDAQPADAAALAKQITADAPAVALIVAVSPGKEKAHLVFSANVDGPDMGKILKDALSKLNGKGGGNPRLAQGGTNQPEGLEQVLAEAENEVKKELTHM